MVVVALARLPVTTISRPVPHRHRHLAAMLASGAAGWRGIGGKRAIS
jgi:hypothetical protein